MKFKIHEIRVKDSEKNYKDFLRDLEERGLTLNIILTLFF